MKQQGMALLIVLLLVATMASVAVSTQTYWITVFSRTENQQFRLQAKWMLLGAEEWIRLKLLATLPTDNVNVGQAWALSAQSFLLDDKKVSYQLSDNQACFNLNAIAPFRSEPEGADAENTVTREPLPHKILKILLLRQGMSPLQTTQLLTTLAASTPLIDVSQLRAMPGIDYQIWQRIHPLVCVQPQKRLRINLNTLQGETGTELLIALTQGQLSHSQAQRQLSTRPTTGWRNIPALIDDTTNDTARVVFAQLQSVATLFSDDMELKLWTEQTPHIYQLRSRFIRTENGFRVTERRYGITD